MFPKSRGLSYIVNMSEFNPHDLQAVLATLIEGQRSIVAKIDDHTEQEDRRWGELDKKLAASLLKEEQAEKSELDRSFEWEKRMRQQEDWKSWMIGGMAAITFCIGFLTFYVTVVKK